MLVDQTRGASKRRQFFWKLRNDLCDLLHSWTLGRIKLAHGTAAPFADDVIRDFEMALESKVFADGKSLVPAVVPAKYPLRALGNTECFVVPVERLDLRRGKQASGG